MFNSLCKAVKKCREKKGFTLVELIVVLVILAILAALLVPTLTGYIDKANEEKVISEVRMVVMAVQTEASSAYGHAGAGNKLSQTTWDADKTTHIDEIKKLSEVLNNSDATFEAKVSTMGKVVSVSYNNGTYSCTYYAQDVKDKDGNVTNKAGSYSKPVQEKKTYTNAVTVSDT